MAFLSQCVVGAGHYLGLCQQEGHYQIQIPLFESP